MWIKDEGYYVNPKEIVGVFAHQTRTGKWYVEINLKSGQSYRIQKIFDSLFDAHNLEVASIISRIEDAEKLTDIAEGKFRSANPAGGTF